MATQSITYGAITFPFNTLEVNQTPIFASDGIQLEGTRYVFNIRGWIYDDSPAALDIKIYSLRTALVKRAQQFTVTWTEGATDTKPYDFAPADVANWGPIPGELSIRRFAGGLSAQYSWSVEIMAKECDTGTCNVTKGITAPAATAVLSLVSKWDHTVDLDGLTTRTLSGKLTVSAASVKAGFTADGYRWYVYPGIPKSFQVQSQQFSCSENGRELTFSVVMQEQCFTKPRPITGGDASFSIRLANYGLMANFSLSGYFTASRMTPKAKILEVIQQLLMNKLGEYINSTTNPAIFENRELTNSEMYGRNRIDFSFTGTFAIGGTGFGDEAFYNGLKQSLVGNPPTNIDAVAQNAFPYGGASQGEGSGVIAAEPLYNHDACNPNLATSTPSPGSGNPPPSSDTLPPPYVENYPEPGNTIASPYHLKAPYIAYHEEIHYELDNGVEVFIPKVAGEDPVVQQSRPPCMTIIQAGYSVRYAKAREDITTGIPDPIGDATNRIMLQSSVVLSNPDPVCDGTASRFTAHWRYVMKVIKPYVTDETDGVEFEYPLDPRRLSSDDPADGGPLDYTKGMLLVAPDSV